MLYLKKPVVDELLKEVRAVYAELAQRPVERDCVRRTECCFFTMTGLTPQLTLGEAMVAAKAWRATGRKQLKSREDGGCPMYVGELGKGKCSIYDSRPFGCRTHFCEAAGGPYGRKEVVDLVYRLESVDAKLGGNGPKSLESAIKFAMNEQR